MIEHILSVYLQTLYLLPGIAIGIILSAISILLLGNAIVGFIKVLRHSY